MNHFRRVRKGGKTISWETKNSKKPITQWRILFKCKWELPLWMWREMQWREVRWPLWRKRM